MERSAVLEDYFTDLTVVHEDVGETEGWARIEDLPRLWSQVSSDVTPDASD